jgi:hypothetical protein
MTDLLLRNEWVLLLEMVKRQGSNNERILASMLLDITNGAAPTDVFNAWSSALLASAE